MNGSKVPKKEIAKAIWQWLYVGFFYGFGWVGTFVFGPLVILTSKKTTSPHGESEETHSEKYIAQGSSGKWYYIATSWPFLSWWNNYEDGLAGEPSGKHSAREGGKEYTYGAMYRWLIRNPFNQKKRTSPFFACFVNDCVIEFWHGGSENPTDKAPIVDGWYFIKATHKTTKKVYYGYRYVSSYETLTGWRKAMVVLVNSVSNAFLKLFNKPVRYLEGTVYNAVFGFKIKPSHRLALEDQDDLDKAFTARVQFASTPD